MNFNIFLKACTGGSIEILNSLYNANSNLNIQNSNGNTPLKIGMKLEINFTIKKKIFLQISF